MFFCFCSFFGLGSYSGQFFSILFDRSCRQLFVYTCFSLLFIIFVFGAFNFIFLFFAMWRRVFCFCCIASIRFSVILHFLCVGVALFLRILFLLFVFATLVFIKSGNTFLFQQIF